MFIGIRAKTNFFYYSLRRFGLYLLKLLLLFVNELVIVDYPANGRYRVRTNFNKVQTLLLGDFQTSCDREYPLLDIITNKAYFARSNVLVDIMFCFLLFKRWSVPSLKTRATLCYKLVLLLS